MSRNKSRKGKPPLQVKRVPTNARTDSSVWKYNLNEKLYQQKVYPCDPVGVHAFELLEKYAPQVAEKVHYRHNTKTGEWQLIFFSSWSNGIDVRVVYCKHNYSPLYKKHVPNMQQKAVTHKTIRAKCEDWENVAGTPLNQLKGLNTDELGTIYAFLKASECIYSMEHFPEKWKW